MRAGPIACNRYPAKNLSKHLPQPAFCKWASNIQPTKSSGFCGPALFSLPCASRARADEETHRHRALRAAPSLPTAVRAASSLPPAVRPPPRSLRQCRAPQNPLHKSLKNPHHHHAGGGNRQAPQQEKTPSAPPSKAPSVQTAPSVTDEPPAPANEPRRQDQPAAGAGGWAARAAAQDLRRVRAAGDQRPDGDAVREGGDRR